MFSTSSRGVYLDFQGSFLRTPLSEVTALALLWGSRKLVMGEGSEL